MKNRIKDMETMLAALAGAVSSTSSGQLFTDEFLATLAAVFECEWATYWEVTEVGLRPSILWNSNLEKPEALIKDTKSRVLSISEGNAGHVWRSRKPIWTQDIAMDMCLPRSVDATKAGLRGGIWFAVKTEKAVYGVVELLSKNLPKPTEELLLAVESLGVKLGRSAESRA